MEYQEGYSQKCVEQADKALKVDVKLASKQSKNELHPTVTQTIQSQVFFTHLNVGAPPLLYVFA